MLPVLPGLYENKKYHCIVNKIWFIEIKRFNSARNFFNSNLRHNCQGTFSLSTTNELPYKNIGWCAHSSQIVSIHHRERWVPRKGAQGEMGREKKQDFPVVFSPSPFPSSPAPPPRALLSLCRALGTSQGLTAMCPN